MDNELTLWCWICGEEPELFQTRTSRTETVSGLKEAITRRRYRFFNSRNIDDHNLNLYSIPLPDDDDLADDLEKWNPDGKTKLNNQRTVANVLNAIDGDVLIIVHARGIAPVPIPDLALNCLVRGEDARRIFTVEISSKKTISILKNVIKSERGYELDPVLLNVYKVSIPCEDNVKERVGQMRFDEPLPPYRHLSNIFSDAPLPEHLHIIVEIPSSGKEIEPDYLAKLFDRIVTIKTKVPPPSQAAKSTRYMAIQGGDEAIMDCRYPANAFADTVAPPIQLYHPAFAFFSSKAFDPTYNAPYDFVKRTGDLMGAFAQIYSSEENRRSNIISHFNRAISYPLTGAPNVDKTAPDFVALGSCGNLSVRLVVGEEKRELGDGGSDPSTQGSFSFLQIYRQAENQELLRRCCCPTFIIAHAGPWLTIMGGVITAKCIVQRLTDFLWIPSHSTHDDGQYRRIARVLYALRESIQQLNAWYETMKDVVPFRGPNFTNHPRFYPSPDTYLCAGTKVKFTYEEWLEEHLSCVTFRAKTISDTPKDVVVKFVTSYGEEVHQMMASAGLAPQLLYCGKIDVEDGMPSYGNLRMVVMEFVEGLTLFEALKQGQVPTRFKSDLRSALELLHAAGYVFGDLRMPNVMVTPGGKQSVQLIDFDWAGKESEVRYPYLISPTISWPDGVEGLGLILQDHDRDMLKKMLSQCPDA